MTKKESGEPPTTPPPAATGPASSKLDASGQLDWSTLNALSQDEFGEWLEQRLSGRDNEVPIDARAGELPHALFVSIYPELRVAARERLINAILDRLRALSKQPMNHAASAELLLMLCAELLPLASEALRKHATELLAGCYKRLERAPSSDTPVPLALRVLQTLVSLSWYARAEYWQRLDERWGKMVVPLAFEAQCLHAPEIGFEWLATRDWSSPEPAAALDALLPTLLETRGRNDVEKWAQERLLPGLRGAARGKAERILERNGIPLETAPVSGVRPPASPGQSDRHAALTRFGLQAPSQIASATLPTSHDERLQAASQRANAVIARVAEVHRAQLAESGYASLKPKRRESTDHLVFPLLDPGINYVLTSEPWFWYLLGGAVQIHDDQCLIGTVGFVRRPGDLPCGKGCTAIATSIGNMRTPATLGMV